MTGYQIFPDDDHLRSERDAQAMLDEAKGTLYRADEFGDHFGKEFEADLQTLMRDADEPPEILYRGLVSNKLCIAKR